MALSSSLCSRGVVSFVLFILLVGVGPSTASAQGAGPVKSASSPSSTAAPAPDQRQVIDALILKQLTAVSRSESPWTTPPVVISIATTLLAVSSLCFNFLQFYMNRRDVRHWKSFDSRVSRVGALLQYLPWFCQSPTHRSVAISLVEGNWSQYPELQETWRSALINQILEVVLQPSLDLSSSDARDVSRMLKLVASGGIDLHEGGGFSDQLISIRSALSELPTKIVYSAAGEALHPTRRQKFIGSITTIFLESALARALVPEDSSLRV